MLPGLALLAIFFLLAHAVVREQEDWFDTQVYKYLNSLSSSDSIEFFRTITFSDHSGSSFLPMFY